MLSHQTDFEVWNEDSPHCGNRVYPVGTPLTKVDRVTRLGCWNRDYDINQVYTDSVEIGTNAGLPDLPGQNESIAVDYTFSSENSYTGPATFTPGTDILTIPLTPIRTRENQLIVGDVTKVISIQNVTKAQAYTAKSIYKDEVYIDLTPGAPDPTDVWEVTVKYVNPIRFMLVHLSEKMKRQGSYIADEGDASMTVPYNCYMGVDDVIIQLVGEQRGQSNQRMTDTNEVELPSFDVTQVLNVEDGTGTVYVPGTDFVIRKGNRMVWITANKPADKFSVIYLYHPAFTIFNIKPTVRTPEDQRMPRRVTLKLFEKLNVNYDLHVQVP